MPTVSLVLLCLSLVLLCPPTSGMNGEEYCQSTAIIRNAVECKRSSCCHFNMQSAGSASFDGKGRCWSSIMDDPCKDMIALPDFVPDYDKVYRLSTLGHGVGMSLDVINDGDHQTLLLSPAGNFPSQAWKFVPSEGGTYRLLNQWLTDTSLDYIKDDNRLRMAPLAPRFSQYWDVKKEDEGGRYWRLTTRANSSKCLDTLEENTNYVPHFKDCEKATRQYWRIDNFEATCSDDVQNGDETGIDCGGSCSACAPPVWIWIVVAVVTVVVLAVLGYCFFKLRQRRQQKTNKTDKHVVTVEARRSQQKQTTDHTIDVDIVKAAQSRPRQTTEQQNGEVDIVSVSTHPGEEDTSRFGCGMLSPLDASMPALSYLPNDFRPQLESAEECLERTHLTSTGASVRQWYGPRYNSAAKLQQRDTRLLETVDMSESQAQVLHAYTADSILCQEVQAAMQTQKGDDPELRDYIYHLSNAITEAPIVPSHDNARSIVYKAINKDVDPDKYYPGACVMWPAYSSCTLDPTVVYDYFAKTEAGCKGTMFIMLCDSAREIYHWSQYPEQKEVVLPPYTQFQVAAADEQKEHIDKIPGLAAQLATSMEGVKIFVLSETNGRADRFFSPGVISPDSGAIPYFGQGFKPTLPNIEAFCQKMNFITTGDHPGLRLEDLWVKKKSDLASAESTMNIPTKAAQTLHAYTVECLLYRKLNRAMRKGNLEYIHSPEFSPYLDFIYFLQRALGLAQELRLEENQLIYRGISARVSPSHYQEDKIVTWHAFSSCSLSLKVALSFAGTPKNKPTGTLFVIHGATTARGISHWSQYPEEEEWLYRDNTHFKVIPKQWHNMFLGNKLKRLAHQDEDSVDISDLQVIVLQEV